MLQTDSINTSCGKNNGSVSAAAISGNAPIIYQWNTGSSTDTLSNLSAGTYAVTLTDSTGCTASANVAVDSSSAPSYVNITAADTAFCSGDSTTICAPSGFTIYLWNTGESSPCINVTLAGNYYVTVTNSSGCADTSSPLAINVLSAPPVTITINGDTLSAFNAVTYQWNFNNAPLPGDTNSVLVASLPGTYSVAVSDSNGCVIMSNNQTITGINNLQDEMALKIYPNPAADYTIIDYGFTDWSKGAVSLEITNALGQAIYTQPLPMYSGYQKIDVTNYAAGVYMAYIKRGNGVVAAQKFVKE